jgi:outer membrane protein assembly factor BamB
MATSPLVTAKAPANIWVDPTSIGRPYGSKVEGLLTFRGNPTRTFYGRGPVQSAPAVAWRYPAKPMCAPSSEKGHTYIWCGTGWTGQPAVFERDGRTWVVFGAYDRAVHFLDARTGQDLRPPFYTGDIIKGSVTIDPDGYPIVYSGSRDGYFRAIAFDGPKPREIWRLSAHAVSPTLWNDDWDGSALVLDDYLFVGGENSQVHIARLNRGYDDKGRATVAPELVFHAPGWDKTLLSNVGDRNVSIENSVSVYGNNLFFSNSGGLAQAWDISGLKHGIDPKKTFSFWTGDDTDASVVVDKEGKLYVASEWERHNKRSASVGQLVKLDPRKTAGADPRLWSFADQKGVKSGIWGTPALYDDLIIAATHTGELVGLDKSTAKVRWRILLQGKSWPSPVVVDGTLIQGDCGGNLRAFDIRDTKQTPKPLWNVKLGGCIESTPAVWKGRIYVGTRDGYFYALSAKSGTAVAER